MGIQSGQAWLVGSAEGMVFPYRVQERDRGLRFVANSWWYREPCDSHVQSLQSCSEPPVSGVLLQGICLKSSVEQEKTRKHMKINSEVLVKTKKGKKGEKNLFV